MAQDASSVDLKVDYFRLYASDALAWHSTDVEGKEIWYRRLGIVENMFDVDGTDFEGRADVNMHTTIELQTDLSSSKLTRRIELAWANLCAIFPLLTCKSLHTADFLSGNTGSLWVDKCFVYQRPRDRHSLLEAAQKHIFFLQDEYPDLDASDFYTHLLNTGRVVDEKVALAKLFVLPFSHKVPGTVTLSTILVGGHEIADGITMYRMTIQMKDLLNMKEEALLNALDMHCSSSNHPTRYLPPAQESFYPMRAKSRAGNRWAWAITRVLRHVRRPPPIAFVNPIRRDHPLQTAIAMPKKYPKVLNYSRVPPLNSFNTGTALPPRANQNFVRLCSQARISLGSGAFTLVALAMMRLEEERTPGIPHWDRLPFVGTFPLNPRPFLSGPSTTGKEKSLMLAFSDGVTLPFLTKDLDLEKGFRVLGRLAHRQLRQYQKRKRTIEEKVQLGSRNPSELLPALYLSTMERLDARVKPEHRIGVSPQGALSARQSSGITTCGISSVGKRPDISVPVIDHAGIATDIKAKYIDTVNTVRVRNGECLVGALGTESGMEFGAACDGNFIDPEKARAWARIMKDMLDYDAPNLMAPRQTKI